VLGPNHVLSSENHVKKSKNSQKEKNSHAENPKIAKKKKK